MCINLPQNKNIFIDILHINLKCELSSMQEVEKKMCNKTKEYFLTVDMDYIVS